MKPDSNLDYLYINFISDWLMMDVHCLKCLIAGNCRRFDELVGTYSDLWCCTEGGATIDKHERESQMVEKWIKILGP